MFKSGIQNSPILRQNSNDLQTEIMSMNKRERRDMHRAIADYLDSNGYVVTCGLFRRDAGLPEIYNRRYHGMLEKYWFLYNRLQFQISELELRIRSKERKLSQRICERLVPAEWIPRPPERLLITGHIQPVTRVAFHPFLNILISTGDDATIKVWDFITGRFLRSIKGHEGGVQDVSFSPVGNRLASASTDWSVKIWDFVTDYSCLHTLIGHEDVVTSVEYLPYADYIISGSKDMTLRLWNAITANCSMIFAGHRDAVRMVRVSYNGSLLASCGDDQTICIWETNDNLGKMKLRIQDHDDIVECIAWGKKDTHPVIAKSMKSEEKISHLGPILASGSRDRTIRVFDVDRDECLFVLSGHANWIRHLVFHSFGRFILSVGDDKTIRAWDLRTRQCVRVFEAHDQAVTCIAMHKRSPLVVTCSEDYLVKVWTCR